MLEIETGEVPTVTLLYGMHGPVMVLHERHWGFVCAERFMVNDNGCGVVCNQLGYRYE